MDLLLVALLVLAVGGVAVVAVGRVRGALAPVDDGTAPPLDGPLRGGEDLDRARFTLALRGYRMDQVDVVLDEARDLLAARDREIDRLNALLAGIDEEPGQPVQPATGWSTATEPSPPVGPVGAVEASGAGSPVDG